MAAISGEQLYNPWKKERIASVFVKGGNINVIGKACDDLIQEVFSKQKAAGKAKPFLVCAIHREKPIHAWMNLSTTYSVDIRPEYPDKDYAGARGNAEALLQGDWYIASPEEYAECERKDADARATALQMNTQSKVGEANKLIAGIFEAAQLQVSAKEEVKPLKPEPVGVGPAVETSKRK